MMSLELVLLCTHQAVVFSEPILSSNIKEKKKSRETNDMVIDIDLVYPNVTPRDTLLK